MVKTATGDINSEQTPHKLLFKEFKNSEKYCLGLSCRWTLFTF